MSGTAPCPRIVAALGAFGPEAIFDRAQVIVEETEGRYRQVDRWEPARGPMLGREDVEGLVHSGEARWLPEPVAAESGVYAWLLGPCFGSGRDHFLQRIERVDGVAARVSGPWGELVLVREGRAGFLRTALSSESRGAARRAIEGGDPAAALLAERAWLSGGRVDPELVALVVRGHEVAGSPGRGAAVRRLERNSQGEGFDAEVGAVLAGLSAPGRLGAPGAAARGKAPWRRSADEAIDRELRMAS